MRLFFAPATLRKIYFESFICNFVFIFFFAWMMEHDEKNHSLSIGPSRTFNLSVATYTFKQARNTHYTFIGNRLILSCSGWVGWYCIVCLWLLFLSRSLFMLECYSLLFLFCRNRTHALVMLLVIISKKYFTFGTWFGLSHSLASLGQLLFCFFICFRLWAVLPPLPISA